MEKRLSNYLMNYECLSNGMRKIVYFDRNAKIPLRLGLGVWWRGVGEMCEISHRSSTNPKPIIVLIFHNR